MAPLHIATHNSNFHADDVCAVAIWRLVHPDATVVRTRDRDLMAAADVRVDVGLADDPATGDFDHHQVGGAGSRDNGVPYASAGLSWRHLGVGICQEVGGLPRGLADAAAAVVDTKLIQIINAHDNGHVLYTAVDDAMVVVGIDRTLAMCNPSWQDDPDALPVAFEQAVTIADLMLRNEIRMAAGVLRARALVREAVDAAEDPRVVVLDRGMPWREALIDYAPQAQYVVFPTTDGRAWGLQGVPAALGSFAVRRPLPAAWAGCQAEQLRAVTGVPDAVFCHTGRFYASAATREGALALATLALV